jgi:hypothetical protein
MVPKHWHIGAKKDTPVIEPYSKRVLAGGALKLVPKPALLREGAVELLCRRIATLWSHAIVQAFSTTPAACEEHS